MATVHISAERISLIPIRPTRRLWHQTRTTWAWLTAWRERRRAIGLLHAMSDAQLKDIGVSRGQIDALASGDLDLTSRRRG